MKNKIFILALSVLFIVGNLNAQECASSSSNAFEWPGHNNWFLPKWTPTNGVAYILNQQSGIVSPVIQPDWTSASNQWNSIRGYEGVAAASNDQGKLIFFTNGRKAWKADGNLITDKLLSGNECGGVDDRSSAAHGTLIVKHPLNPLNYYIITVEDVVNTGCPIKGVSVAIIDSSGNLVNASLPIDSYTNEGRETYRTTEGIAATMHGNGVDVWVTVQPLDVDYYLSYLLTANGFSSAPVISTGMAIPTDVRYGFGTVTFSWDGKYFASVHDVNPADEGNAPNYAYNTVSLYDFDNWTGKISNHKAVYDKLWSSATMFTAVFSADNKELHYGGPHAIGKVLVDAGTAEEIRATTTVSPFLKKSFETAGITFDGKIVNRSTINAQYELGGVNEFGMNNMFIPPSDKPQIGRVDTLCATLDSIYDLSTNWICTGLNAELALGNDDHDFGYFGKGIIAGDGARLHGYFNPSLAGEGTHEINFVYHGVSQTINIAVDNKACPDQVTNTLNLGDRSLDMYPNPTSNYIWFSNEQVVAWELYSFQGTLISTGKSSHIDLSGFGQGSYFIKTRKGVFKVTKK